MADQYMNSADQDYAAFYASVTGQDPKKIAKDGQLPKTTSSLPAGVSRVTPEGLNVYSRKTVAVDDLGQPITQKSSAASKPPTVTFVPSQSQPTDFQKAMQPLATSIPVFGPIGNGIAVLSRMATAAPSSNIPSPPPPKGYNTRTGDYEVMVPSEPYAAAPAPVRTADNKAGFRLGSEPAVQLGFVAPTKPSWRGWNPALKAIDAAAPIAVALGTPMPRRDPRGYPSVAQALVSPTPTARQPDTATIIAEALAPMNRQAQIAALQQQAQVTNDPLIAAAMAAGRTTYGSPTSSGALGDNALMPTVAMNGNPIRNR